MSLPYNGCNCPMCEAARKRDDFWFNVIIPEAVRWSVDPACKDEIKWPSMRPPKARCMPEDDYQKLVNELKSKDNEIASLKTAYKSASNDRKYWFDKVEELTNRLSRIDSVAYETLEAENKRLQSDLKWMENNRNEWRESWYSKQNDYSVEKDKVKIANFSRECKRLEQKIADDSRSYLSKSEVNNIIKQNNQLHKSADDRLRWLKAVLRDLETGLNTTSVLTFPGWIQAVKVSLENLLKDEK